MTHVQFDAASGDFVDPPPALAGTAGPTEAVIPLASPDRELQEPNGFVARALQFFMKSDSIPYGTVLVSLLWSAIVVSLSHLESRSYIGGGKDCQWWCSRVSIDASASTYAGLPLFLLLGFRVNEAYGRYLEAASIWGVELKMYVVQFLTHVGTAFRPGLFSCE
jgi:hypothetical protein